MGQSQPTIFSPSVKDPTIVEELGSIEMTPISEFQSYFTLQYSNNYQHHSDAILLFNDKNCSLFERILPEELFIYILQFLSNSELIKLRRVCKNYENYWIQYSKVWKLRKFEGDQMEILFKPKLENPIKSIIYYYTQFLPIIVNSFQRRSLVSMNPKMVSSKFISSEKDSSFELFKSLETLPLQSKYNSNYSLSISDFSEKIASSNIRSDFYSAKYNILTFCFDLGDKESFVKMKLNIKTFITTLNEPVQNWKSHGFCCIIIGMKMRKRVVKKSTIEMFVSELAFNDGVSFENLPVQYFELDIIDEKSNTFDKLTSTLVLPFVYGMVLTEKFLIERETLMEASVQFMRPAK